MLRRPERWFIWDRHLLLSLMISVGSLGPMMERESGFLQVVLVRVESWRLESLDAGDHQGGVLCRRCGPRVGSWKLSVSTDLEWWGALVMFEVVKVWQVLSCQCREEGTAGEAQLSKPMTSYNLVLPSVRKVKYSFVLFSGSKLDILM